ncbi:hypothetical protein Ahy_B09g098956 isoform G [Arachis hypogaea]|uniref:Uncharacterized protein n=1 Tax=Arachis hypogaea TaxID=3818 RepID=A0A444XSM2_ARAHY|nr:hypothetical protein Ahy_B09g098956 isoform G [Arachis hypogaea]
MSWTHWFMIFMYFFETYLDIRQLKALKLPTLPKTLEGVISQDKFLKSRAYSLDKSLVDHLVVITNFCFYCEIFTDDSRDWFVRFPVGGIVGALSDSVTVFREKNKITITSDSNFSKR